MTYIEIPKEITTAQDKMAYALRCAELLKLKHNKKGAAVDKQDPAALKTFHDWQTTVFEPVQQEALHIANLAKQAMYKSETWDSEIDVEAWIAAKEADVRK